MRSYIQEAVRVVSDNRQTLYAKQMAKTLLQNAGYSEDDIRLLATGEKKPEDVWFIFA